MFYGQNCSGRLGERKSFISVVGCKKDHNFIKLVESLKIKKIKKDLNSKHFSRAIGLAKKYGIRVSILIVPSKQFGYWKSLLKHRKGWFGKLYGIFVYKAMEPIIVEKVHIHMDREYDTRTLNTSKHVLMNLLKIREDNVYIRQEKEYPSIRIQVADLFARGIFRGFKHDSLIVRENVDIEDEVKKIFENRVQHKLIPTKDKPSRDCISGRSMHPSRPKTSLQETVSVADKLEYEVYVFKTFG